MTKRSLSVALNAYEHAIDLLTDRVRAEGIDVNWLRIAAATLGARFAQRREFDVAEMALADYVARLSRGDRSILALPVFLDRQFMAGAVWVRPGGPLRDLDDLRKDGLRCAADDATIALYMRQWLGATIGLTATSPWPSLTTAELQTKLAAGEIDVGFSLNRLKAEKGIVLRRLIGDIPAAEQTAFQTTKVFPILRVVCVQRDLAIQHPWLVASLFDGFDQAKRASLGRLIGAGMSRYPLPWLNAEVTRIRAVYGEDFWPYGIAANRPTLEAFLATAKAQGVCGSSLTVEDLFDAAL